jgi:myosin heavy subunit
MGRTKGTKNKNKTVNKVVNTAKNKNVININVHSKTKPKPKRRTKTTVKPPNTNPLSNSINDNFSRGASQNLGFHPRGLINNEPQQPTIINIQPSAQVAELEKKLKKYKEKLNSHKTAQETTNQNLLTQLSAPTTQPSITVTQPPINVNVNPLNPSTNTQPNTTIIKTTNTPNKRSALRHLRSKTKAGTFFKPTDLDEVSSLAGSIASNKSGLSVVSNTSSASRHSATPPATNPLVSGASEIEEEPLTGAKTTAERMAGHHERQSPEEKKLNNRYYALKGTGTKKGAIKTAEEVLQDLESRTNKKKGDAKRIEDKKRTIKELKDELIDVEQKLTKIKESRTPVKKGRPAAK